ncbi:hypothetical protein PAMP_017035 [Pampus punctatissimus]
MEVLLLVVKSVFLLLSLFILKSAADCPEPHTIVITGNIVLSDGALLLNSFPEGVTIPVECGNGYVKENGTGSMSCNNGNWSKPDLNCKRKDCGRPKDQPNMIFNIKDGTLFGDEIKVTCDEGYVIRGSRYKTCFAHGWSGYSSCQNTSSTTESSATETTHRDKIVTTSSVPPLATKSPSQQADCPEPHTIVITGNIVLSDGALLLNSFPEGVTIPVECGNGYVKENGTGSMSCNNGNWSKPDLNCKRKDCGRPKDQPNMIFNIKDGTLFGDEIKVTCDEGYVIRGSRYKTCFAHGWSGYSSCQTDCPEPHTVLITGNIVLSDGALLLNSYPEGVTIPVECGNGYVKENGTGSMSCNNGNWSKPDLNCKRKDCGRPKDQPNMIFNIKDGTLFGDEIKVTCDEGYVIRGSRYKTCFAHGWSGYSSCQNTSSTTESSATETTHRDKTVTTSSVPPLATKSPSQQADCPEPHTIVITGNIVLSDEALLLNSFPEGVTIPVECGNGYVKENGTGSMSCNNGNWSKPDLNCKRKDCGRPKDQPNMIFNIKDGTLFGDEIKVTCDEGYVIRGSRYKTCFAHGWSGYSSCQTDCPEPHTVLITGNIVLSDEALLLNSFPEGVTIPVECGNGYVKENGTGSMSCNNGNWSKPDLNCKRKDCGRPKDQPNMIFNIKDGTLFGDEIKVTCDEGYVIRGSRYKTCFAHGWSGYSSCQNTSSTTESSATETTHRDKTVTTSSVPPLATKSPSQQADCPEPHTIVITGNIVLSDGALLLNSFPEGVTIPVECGNGYVKENGTGSMSCNNGNWSKPDLNCKRKDCGRPKDQPNMIFNIKDGTLFGDEIKVTCDEGYVISGSSYKTCFAHGWSGHSSCQKYEVTPTPTPPTQDTSSTTESSATETTHRDKTITTSSVPPLATKSPSQQEFDKNKDNGYTPVIISVICVSLVVCIVVFFTSRFFQKRGGSYDTREDLKPELLHFQNI